MMSDASSPQRSNGTATLELDGDHENGAASTRETKNGAINGAAANGTNGSAIEAHAPVEVEEPSGGENLPATISGDGSPVSDTTLSWTPVATPRKMKKDGGLKFARRFTTAGADVFDSVEWELRTAAITGEDGKIVFEQVDCEIPKSWSQLATNVVVSKYFRGPLGSPRRETSVRQVIGRVVDTFHKWGVAGGYFATTEDAQAFRDELAYLLLNQYGSFNSPVWFNIGVEGAKQQGSACQPYDALVSTPSGLIPIGKLVEDDAIGLAVYDAGGEARIVATKTNGIKRVLRLHTKAGYTLDVTPDHLVWKATGYGKDGATGKFVEAGTLRAGDSLMWTRTPAVDKAQEPSGEEAEAALAGWLQSDGFVGQYESGTNRSLTAEAIVVNAEEEAWVRGAMARVLAGVHSHTREVETQDADLQCRRIRVYGQALRPFIEKWDLLARRHEMRVPPQLFAAPLSVAAAYLRSLFQAEGYVSVRDNARIGLDMISEDVVHGAQSLLLRFGIYSRVRFKADARDNRSGCWSLSIRTLGDRERFAEEIGFVGAAKQGKLESSFALKGLRCGDRKRLEIERIEERGEMPVYDIQTSSGEYLSGNLRVHNCFINSVHDNMESIMELAATEARLFKGGSGAGSNLSRIRSSKEHLSGGGIASGPVSFMRGWDAFAGAIKCLTPDAQVYTDQGLRAIGELIDPNLAPGFHADDSVVLQSKDGAARISQVYVSPEAPTRQMQLSHTGLRLRGTLQHPVLTLSPAFQLEWKALSDIKSGDRVAVSRGQEMWPAAPPSSAEFEPQTTWAKKTLTYPTQMTSELARLLGYLTAEGCMDAGRFRFCNADADVFSDFLRCVEAVFGVDASGNVSARVHPTTGVTTQLFEACWTNAVRFLQRAGLGFEKSGEKRVPRSVMSSPRALVEEFLRAYFEGDGHVSSHVYASSASRALLSDVQLLLLNMGILPLLRRHPVAGRDYWSLYLRGDAAFRFAREIGFVSARKQAAAERLGDKNLNTNIDTVPFLVDALRQRAGQNGNYQCADGTRQLLHFGFFNRKAGSAISYQRLRNTPALLDGIEKIEPQLAQTLEWILEREFFWDAVESVEEAAPAVTYDFTVPETHSFVANGIVNHNSGGTTRRAAKMVILDAQHPDIREFINCKADEEKKAWALIEAGYNGGFNMPGGAYDSVDFQNANHSVRVTDEFMRAAENNVDWSTRAVVDGAPVEAMKARDLLYNIAEATHICGDPGMQYDTTINDWHTSANTDRIYASNPCCVTGDTLVAVADGRNAVAMRDLVGSEVPVYAHDHATGKTVISRMWNIEAKRRNAPIYHVTLDDGSSFRATDDHLIMQRDGSYRMVRDLKNGDSLMPFHSKVLAPQKSRTRRRFIWNGASWTPQYRAIWNYFYGEQPASTHIHHFDFNALNDLLENLILMDAAAHNALHVGKMQGDNNPARRGMNDAWRAAISRAVSGEGNPNFGKTHSEATRALMSAKAKARCDDAETRAQMSQNAKSWMSQAKQESRQIGRPRGERFARCCPVCRANFETPRETQIFCGLACRHSPMGMQMCGEKTWSKNRGRALSTQHRAKLSDSVSAASDSRDKRRACEIGQRNGVLKTARLLLDNGITPSLGSWDETRAQARALGVSRVPTASTVARHFTDDAALQQHAELFNHKVASVEFCGQEDVYDGTVDTHHNFAILTSGETSCAAGHQNFSGIFIHNSEFVFLDDTACNLASLNLMKFRSEGTEFDSDSFIHACEAFITAQEIIVSNASYPTEKIAQNSEEYRPLGLGYANLGALLMAQGTAYDSDEGRALAGAITAVMTGAAYRQSARIAANIGPFSGYAKNREPMLRVIAKHRDAVSRIHAAPVPADTMNAAHRVWDEALLLGQKHGFRNAQATVLAPTGCLVGESLVATDRGLVRLETLGDTGGATWQDADFAVQTDDGPRRATQFFINGMAETRRLRTQAGYAIQGTLKHRIKVVDAESGEWQWKRFADVAGGDIVPLAMNGLIGEPQKVVLPPLSDLHWNADFQTRVPREMSPELAELVGYFMGDGSLHAKGLRLCVAQNDSDVIERLRVLARELFDLEVHCAAKTGYVEVALHSVPLAIWWDACGFGKTRPHEAHSGKGWTPRVPDAVLGSNDARVYNAFLRGLYEADGTLIEGVPSVSTASEGFASEIHSLLLILGFPATCKTGSSGWGDKTLHSLRLRNGSYNARFRGEIGFIGARKNDAILEIKDTAMTKRDRIPLPADVVRELAPCGHPLRDAMLLSLRRHGAVSRASAITLFAQTGDDRLRRALDFFYDTVESNEDGGERMTYDLSVPSNVTYVANGFVSHNTIAFMMDCDTTGIEPDIALVKYKKLVGGGLLKIVNQTVPEALRKLGYSPATAEEIVEYIDANDTIEGAPQLKDEHLPVFDCAFKAQNGTRSISHMGHIKMMSAAQPFISGAISKCVTGETLIASERGLMPINAFYRGEKPGEFSEMSLRLASVGAPQEADMFYYGGVQPTIRLNLADGRRIEGTWVHRVKVANREGYDWKRLSEITPDDYVAVKLGAEVWAREDALLNWNAPAPERNLKSIRVPQRMTPRLARFLGQYIAEGNVAKSNWTLRVTNNNPAVLRACIETVREEFGLEGRIETDKRNGVTSFVVASRSLCQFMEHIGCGGNSSTKHIPWSVLQSSRESVREFVGGLWQGGYVRRDGMVAICLNSPELLRQLQVVLNNFGLRAHIIRKWNARYAKHFHELGLHGADARRFGDLFTLDDEHKSARLRELAATPKRVLAVHSDVVPCFRSAIEAAIRNARQTMQWRHALDPRTKTLSWNTVRAAYQRFGLEELREIVEDNVHFVRVRDIAEGIEPVYDFQVPSNHTFLGNGIVNHNTVNVPAEATVEDIMDAYLQSWKLGIKAVAIYRDGSKRTQPLSTTTDAKIADAKAAKDAPRAARRKLPDERQAITHKFSIAGQEGYFTVGLYEDGAPGEIFIKMSKEGSTISGLMDSFAVAVSMCLQYGVPLRVLVNKFSHTRFEPSGFTTNKDIPIAKSLMDYIFRWFDLRFHPNGEDGVIAKAQAPAQPTLLDAGDASTRNGAGDGHGDSLSEHMAHLQQDAPPCSECGTIMVRAGACYKCNNCGTTSGCG